MLWQGRSWVYLRAAPDAFKRHAIAPTNLFQTMITWCGTFRRAPRSCCEAHRFCCPRRRRASFGAAPTMIDGFGAIKGGPADRVWSPSPFNSEGSSSRSPVRSRAYGVFALGHAKIRGFPRICATPGPIQTEAPGSVRSRSRFSSRSRLRRRSTAWRASKACVRPRILGLVGHDGCLPSRASTSIGHVNWLRSALPCRQPAYRKASNRPR